MTLCAYWGQINIFGILKEKTQTLDFQPKENDPPSFMSLRLDTKIKSVNIMWLFRRSIREYRDRRCTGMERTKRGLFCATDPPDNINQKKLTSICHGKDQTGQNNKSLHFVGMISQKYNCTVFSLRVKCALSAQNDLLLFGTVSASTVCFFVCYKQS